MLESSNIYYKQVQLLLEVLPYINNEECFALKGGTAINMFVRDMPRLSVDIDLRAPLKTIVILRGKKKR